MGGAAAPLNPDPGRRGPARAAFNDGLDLPAFETMETTLKSVLGDVIRAGPKEGLRVRRRLEAS